MAVNGVYLNKDRILEGERGISMDEEVRMLISGFVVKDKKRFVRISFTRGKAYAEGIVPDGIIERSEGFNGEEILKLEKFIRVHKEEILAQAKEINPIRSWLRE
jgi:hypothetical protein